MQRWYTRFTINLINNVKDNVAFSGFKAFILIIPICFPAVELGFPMQFRCAQLREIARKCSRIARNY